MKILFVIIQDMYDEKKITMYEYTCIILVFFVKIYPL